MFSTSLQRIENRPLQKFCGALRILITLSTPCSISNKFHVCVYFETDAVSAGGKLLHQRAWNLVDRACPIVEPAAIVLEFVVVEQLGPL